MAILVGLGRAGLLLLVVACRPAAPATTRSSPERALAERVAGCYALSFADPGDAGRGTSTSPDRMNLAAHDYVELVGPSSRFTYGQLPARPALDSTSTDYVRPGWVPLPPDTVAVFWTHVRTPVAALEARLGVSGDSLVGTIHIGTDVPARPGSPPAVAAVARRTQCRAGVGSRGT